MPKRQPANFTEPFTVTNGMRELAQRKGWPNPDDEVEEFVDHYTATGWRMKGGQPIVDRDAAFRLWLRNRARWNEERQRMLEPQETEPIRHGAWGRKLG